MNISQSPQPFDLSIIKSKTLEELQELVNVQNKIVTEMENVSNPTMYLKLFCDRKGFDVRFWPRRSYWYCEVSDNMVMGASNLQERRPLNRQSPISTKRNRREHNVIAEAMGARFSKVVVSMNIIEKLKRKYPDDFLGFNPSLYDQSQKDLRSIYMREMDRKYNLHFVSIINTMKGLYDIQWNHNYSIETGHIWTCILISKKNTINDVGFRHEFVLVCFSLDRFNKKLTKEMAAKIVVESGLFDDVTLNLEHKLNKNLITPPIDSVDHFSKSNPQDDSEYWASWENARHFYYAGEEREPDEIRKSLNIGGFDVCWTESNK